MGMSVVCDVRKSIKWNCAVRLDVNEIYANAYFVGLMSVDI